MLLTHAAIIPCPGTSRPENLQYWLIIVDCTIVEDLPRDSLHQEIAGAVEAYRHQRHDEVVERAFDPERSYPAYVDSELSKDDMLVVVPETGEAVGMRPKPPKPSTLAGYVRLVCDEDAFSLDAPDAMKRIIRGAEHRSRSDAVSIEEAIFAVCVLAQVAACYKPQDLDVKTMHRKMPGETEGSKMFRVAFAALNQKPKSVKKNEAPVSERLSDPDGALADLRDPEKAPAFAEQLNRSRLTLIRQRFAKRILEPDVNARDAQDDYEVRNLLEDKELESAAAKETPIRQTEWTILPKAVTQDADVEHILNDIHQNADSSGIDATTPEARIDPSRVRSLGELAVSWGPDAYIVVSKLKTGDSKKRYLGAVLPQTLPDGRVIEHFVADNPNLENALYVWRGEKGVDPETGQVVRTWEDVFDKHRTEARDLGAHRMNHTATIGERVLEYLTRNPKDL
jgi:hypothetical protein